MQCKYSVWVEFKKHLLDAFQQCLYKITQTEYEDCNYYEYNNIQKLHDYNLTQHFDLSDNYIYEYLHNNMETYQRTLIHYDLYGFYCFYGLLNNLEKVPLMTKTISIGTMHDICNSFEKIIHFFNNEKSLKCARIIQQIFKNYCDINKYTIISVSSLSITPIVHLDDEMYNVVFK